MSVPLTDTHKYAHNFKSQQPDGVWYSPCTTDVFQVASAVLCSSIAATEEAIMP